MSKNSEIYSFCVCRRSYLIWSPVIVCPQNETAVLTGLKKWRWQQTLCLVNPLEMVFRGGGNDGLKMRRIGATSLC